MNDQKRAQRGRVVELSHPIRDGMVTYPGIPGPVLGVHLSREASGERYAPGTEFFIGTISMVANTGTYVDVPFHRFPDGADLAHVPAAALAYLPGVLVRGAGREPLNGTSLDAETLDGIEVRGRAVLFHTGWDRHFGTPEYGSGAPFLTEASAQRLIEGGAALVGIDSLNIDSTADARRPVHTALLAAGIPIVEHMTGLAQLPDDGFEVTALPALVEGLGSFPVRVIARILA
jgi:arylformamidase